MNRTPAPYARPCTLALLALCVPALIPATRLAARPLITEILASNTQTMADEDGDFPDWLELHNPTGSPIDIGGYCLTDDPDDLLKWELPDVRLEPGDYLVVFASNKDRADPGRELHTNFKLSAGGEYLALVDPDGSTLVQEFDPGFPPQQSDQSYGLVAPDPAAQPAFFPSPTPGSVNTDPSNASTALVQFSQPGGIFAGTLALELSTDVPGATIRYTTNGNIPSILSGRVYSNPITISEPAKVRAHVIEPGKTPGPNCENSYLPVEPSLLEVTSNLPIMVLDNFGAGRPSNWTDGFWAIYEPAEDGGRTSLGGDASLATRAAFKVRGSSTGNWPKFSMTVEARDEAGMDKDVSPLGMPEESDWVLSGRYTFDRALLRNPFIYALSNQMGRYAVRTRFVEVYVNTGNDPVSSSDYFGVYTFMEKIKRGRDRVDVAALGPDDNSGEVVTGGYMVKIDRADPGDAGFSAGGQTLRYVEPKEEDITPAQATYIRNYINDFNAALTGPNSAHPELGFRAYIDTGAWIDEHILRLLTKDPDGLRLSTYFHKDRGEKWKYGPVWDFDRTMGCDQDGRALTPTGWNPSSGMDYFGYTWWRELLQDDDFWQEWQDRWAELRRGQLNVDNMDALIDSLAVQIAEAQVRNFNRWPQNRPNGGQFASTGGWEGEVEHLKGWLKERVEWIDGQLRAGPSLDPPPGEVAAGTSLRISAPGVNILNPNAGIFYTTDGSDPRLPGGAISPAAIRYGSPINLQESQTLTLRVHESDDWSAPLKATYLVGTTPASPENIVVSEIMYHPAAPAPGEVLAGFAESSLFEYIELLNTSDRPVNLGAARFSQGVSFGFAGAENTVLEPGGYALLVADRAAFAWRYGAGLPVFGQFAGGRLNDGGETVALSFGEGGPELVIPYGDQAPWPEMADGPGFSLTLIDPLGGSDPAAPESWRAGRSPGVSGPAPAIPAVVINEVLANSAAPQVDAVELYNPTAETVDIGGWYLSDDRDQPQKFRIPAPAELAPGAYLVFDETDFNPTPGTPEPSHFALSSLGESVYLFSAGPDPAALTGYSHRFTFGASAEGVSFGRVLTAGGQERFTALGSITLDAPNATPQVGPVVISEIMYHPDVEVDGLEDEFVELVNTSAQAVDLFDPGAPANTWQLGGIAFDFPVAQTLAPGEIALVVNRDPVSFRETHGVPAGIKVFGPFAGSLNNGGERLSLRRPDTPPSPADEIPMVTVDSLAYGDTSPWPGQADGGGHSIARVDLDAFADDGANWAASELPGGTPGTLPVVDSPLAGWLASFFEAAQLADPAVSGGAADPDFDGVPNLLEFVLDGDPSTPATSGGGLPFPTFVTEGADEYLQYSLRRRQDAAGFQYLVEVSSDLELWEPVSPAAPPQDNGDGTETVTYRDDASAGDAKQRFFRLTITSP